MGVGVQYNNTHIHTHTHSLARTHQSTPVEDIDLVKDPHTGTEVSHCMETEVSHHLSRSRHVRTSTSSVSPVGGRDIPLRIGPRPRACQTRLNPVFTTPWCEPESVRYPLYVHLCVHVRVRMCLFMHTSYLHIHDERARERTHELESERRHLNP